MSLPENVTYSIVNAGLSGVIIIPLFVIWVVALCTAHRRRDPARTGFTWMKVVYPFELLAILLLVVSDAVFAIYVLYIDDYFDDFNTNTLDRLNQAFLRTSFVSQFFERVADVLMMISLVLVGTGFMYAISGVKTTIQKALFIAVLVAAVVLTAMNLAVLGRVNALYSAAFNGDISEVTFDRELAVMQKLSSAFDIISWIISLAIVGLGIMVAMQVKAKPFMRSSAIVYVAATIVWFVRWLWFLIYVAAWSIPARRFPQAYNIVDAIFNVWLFFVALVLLYVVGVRKGDKGVWSNQGQQPMLAGAPQAGYVYGAPQQQMYQQNGGYMQPQPVQYQTGWQQQQQPQQYQQYQYGPPPTQSVSPYSSEPVNRSPPQQQITPAPEVHENGHQAHEVKG